MKTELSYFKLSLIKYLSDNSSPLLSDKKFIKSRVEDAEFTYTESMLLGHNIVESIELANQVLFKDL